MRTSKQGTRGALLTVFVVVLGAVLPATAQEGGDDKNLEKNLEAALRDVINRGAALFNNQTDFGGCYRLFEGALITVRPMLAKYPEVQKKIDRGLQDASAMPRMHDRAHALRKVLDEVRMSLNPAVAVVPKALLWDRLGGEANITKVIDEFVKTAAVDPAVNFDRGGKFKLDEATVAMVKKQFLTFISHVTGGPYQYKGKDMKDVHKGMGITDDEFNATAGHLKKALEKYSAKPADVNELLKALAALRPEVVEPKNGKAADKKIEKIDAPDPNMSVMSGQVMLKDKPLSYGFVTFVDADGRQFSANIKKDGSYAFKKGFLPGKYTVVIEESPTLPEPGEVRAAIPALYQSPATTPLKIKAEKGKWVQDIHMK
jgi:hemoglobin